VTRHDGLAKPTGYLVDGFWQKPNQSPYLWLASNGLIEDGERLERGVLRVVLTSAGIHLLEQVDPAAGRRRIAFWWAQQAFPDSDNYSRGLFADDFAENGDGMTPRAFFDTCDYWV
jgi:hypothetical protein